MSNDRCDCYECISRREPRDAATHVEGREAPTEACEMPASSGGAAWAATVEACARAAYETRIPGYGHRPWDDINEQTKEAFRVAARAVLAAADGANR